jgi:hypothetical protein
MQFSSVFGCEVLAPALRVMSSGGFSDAMFLRRREVILLPRFPGAGLFTKRGLAPLHFGIPTFELCAGNHLARNRPISFVQGEFIRYPNAGRGTDRACPAKHFRLTLFN